MDQYFPWEDVEACIQDPKLEKSHGVKAEYLPEARACPTCNTPPEKLRWIYFITPPVTWEQRRGRAGYLLICEKCRRQVDFFCEVRG